MDRCEPPASPRDRPGEKEAQTVSALLVPPSRVCSARNRGVVALRTITPETYRAFLASPEGAALGAGFLQCPSWADVKEGWRSRLLGWGPDPEAGALTGVALVLLPGFIRGALAFKPVVKRIRAWRPEALPNRSSGAGFG